MLNPQNTEGNRESACTCGCEEREREDEEAGVEAIDD